MIDTLQIIMHEVALRRVNNEMKNQITLGFITAIVRFNFQPPKQYAIILNWQKK